KINYKSMKQRMNEKVLKNSVFQSYFENHKILRNFQEIRKSYFEDVQNKTINRSFFFWLNLISFKTENSFENNKSEIINFLKFQIHFSQIPHLMCWEFHLPIEKRFFVSKESENFLKFIFNFDSK